MKGVALLPLWALNKGIFGAKQIPKKNRCLLFFQDSTNIMRRYFLSNHRLDACSSFLFQISRRTSKLFFLFHLFAWGLHPTDLSSLSLSFFQFSDLRLVAVCFHLARASLIVCQDKASHQLLISDKGL